MNTIRSLMLVHLSEGLYLKQITTSEYLNTDWHKQNHVNHVAVLFCGLLILCDK